MKILISHCFSLFLIVSVLGVSCQKETNNPEKITTIQKLRNERDSINKEYYEDLLNKRNKSGQVQPRDNGSVSSQCQCEYVVTDFQVSHPTTSGYDYNLVSNAPCANPTGIPFPCDYFGGAYCTYPICCDDTGNNPDCIDIFSQPIPSTGYDFECEVPRYSYFDAVFSCYGIEEGCINGDYVQSASITFHLVCYDLDDPLPCSEGKSYVSDDITLNIPGSQGFLSDITYIQLTECGCSPIEL